jgi:hypothetical protein
MSLNEVAARLGGSAGDIGSVIPFDPLGAGAMVFIFSRAQGGGRSAVAAGSSSRRPISIYRFRGLTDGAETADQISAFCVPEAAGGYRYDDAAFGIAWPLPVPVISERDLGWPRVAMSAS